MTDISTGATRSSMSMEAESKYYSMMSSLEGVTVLEKPRVSRDVIVEVLKEHTELIRALQVDIKVAYDTISSQSEDLLAQRRTIEQMGDEIKKNKAEINNVRKANAKLGDEIKDIKQELSITAVKIAGLGNIMELEQTTHRLIDDFQEHKRTTEVSITGLYDKTKETNSRLIEFKEEMKDTTEQLVLPSSQIMVEFPSSPGGKNTSPMNLLDVLAEYNSTMMSTQRKLSEHSSQISVNTNEISTKADASVVFDIDGVGSRVSAIEAHIKKESQQGVSEIRRQCEELTQQIETIQIELAEKINRDNVDLIVHKKYEDIVQYLHEALQASKSDEETFNKKADELRDAVKRLGISKADRFEIAGMQEMVTKTESFLSKLKNQELSGHGNHDKQGPESISKSEVLELLSHKLDKSEVENLLKQAGTIRRRSLLAGGLPEVIDKSAGIGGPNYVKGEGMFNKSSSRERDDILNNGISSNNSAVTPSGGNNNLLYGSFSNNSSSPSSSPVQFSSFGVTGPDQVSREAELSRSLKVAVEGRGLGAANTSGKSDSGSQKSVHSSSVSSVQMQRGSQPGESPGDRFASVRVPISSPEFGTFIKQTTLQTAGKQSLPAGMFHSASDANNLGLPNIADEKNIVSYFPEYEFSKRPDMSYVGAPVVGAGFNMRSANIVKGPVIAPTYQALSQAAEREGAAKTIKGKDGHFYQTQRENDNSSAE